MRYDREQQISSTQNNPRLKLHCAEKHEPALFQVIDLSLFLSPVVLQIPVSHPLWNQLYHYAGVLETISIQMDDQAINDYKILIHIRNQPTTLEQSAHNGQDLLKGCQLPYFGHTYTYTHAPRPTRENHICSPNQLLITSPLASTADNLQ